MRWHEFSETELFRRSHSDCDLWWSFAYRKFSKSYNERRTNIERIITFYNKSKDSLIDVCSEDSYIQYITAVKETRNRVKESILRFLALHRTKWNRIVRHSNFCHLFFLFRFFSLFRVITYSSTMSISLKIYCHLSHWTASRYDLRAPS